MILSRGVHFNISNVTAECSRLSDHDQMRSASQCHYCGIRRQKATNQMIAARVTGTTHTVAVVVCTGWAGVLDVTVVAVLVSD